MQLEHNSPPTHHPPQSNIQMLNTLQQSHRTQTYTRIVIRDLICTRPSQPTETGIHSSLNTTPSMFWQRTSRRKKHRPIYPITPTKGRGRRICTEACATQRCMPAPGGVLEWPRKPLSVRP